jgi:hypothetical protein
MRGQLVVDEGLQVAFQLVGFVELDVACHICEHIAFELPHAFWGLTDEIIYNQGGGATMKRGGNDMREELGYIPPPNRKLPPVPGNNQYNTCDRIKRGKWLYHY